MDTSLQPPVFDHSNIRNAFVYTGKRNNLSLEMDIRYSVKIIHHVFMSNSKIPTKPIASMGLQ